MSLPLPRRWYRRSLARPFTNFPGDHVRHSLIAALAAWPFAPLAAQGEPADSLLSIEQLEASLAWKRGDIVIAEGRALLKVPDGFRYLGPEDAERVPVAWGNPPGSSSLGMVFPGALSPFSDEGWGVVITFENDGYVKDDDAARRDYDELLRKMREASAEENKERQGTSLRRQPGAHPQLQHSGSGPPWGAGAERGRGHGPV